MCNYTRQSQTIKSANDWFKTALPDDFNEADWYQSNFINGFSHPNIPILHDRHPGQIITNYTWGLLPHGRSEDFRKNTLNARVETLEDKPSFTNYLNNRCCIITDGYYDWHWNDEKGKSKTKYQVNSQEAEIFCLAGIYNSFTDPAGKVWNTYSIATTSPDPTMKWVHNRKAMEGDERMPIMLRTGDEQAWMDVKSHPLDFAYPNYQPSLVAFPAD